MRISDWSSDVCSSDLVERADHAVGHPATLFHVRFDIGETLEIGGQGGLPAHGDAVDRFGPCRDAGAERGQPRKIGRASCRGSGCQYVSISVVAVSLKKKQQKTSRSKSQTTNNT